MKTPLLEMKGITKRFPNVIANEGVDLELYPGEVVALLGENGAGKSSLMNVLAGLYRADEGEILIRGKSVEITSPRDAMLLGIGMVHQNFMLVDTMTVAENIILGMSNLPAVPDMADVSQTDTPPLRKVQPSGRPAKLYLATRGGRAAKSRNSEAYLSWCRDPHPG